MKKVFLIGTLPNLNDEKNLIEMINHPSIDAYRFNSGVNQLMSIDEIIKILKQIQEVTKKKVWIDLKGRQLRITSWANPTYEAIELNHEIEIEYPAKVLFRDGHTSEIIRCRKNKILLDRSPFHALGKGQSINIKAKSLEIKGYLTNEDKELLRLSEKYGINTFMASFIEEIDDLIEILRINPKAQIISKIETLKGIEFALNELTKINIMVGRDDLYTNLENSYLIIKYLKELIKKDQNAICASKIFTSLERSDEVDLKDYEDLELMYQYGYKTFMLQDDLKGPKLIKALNSWENFKNG